jgi:hypothetical protein
VLKSLLLFVGSGVLFLALTELVAVTAIVTEIVPDQRNFLTCFFWLTLVGSLSASLTTLQDDKNQRYEVGTISLIDCCISWIAVVVRWCRQEVVEGWIYMVAASSYSWSRLCSFFFLCLNSYAFEVFFNCIIIVRPNPCVVLEVLPSGEVNRLDTYPPGRLLLNRGVSNALGLKYHEQVSFNVAFAQLDIHPRVVVSNCVLHRIQHVFEQGIMSANSCGKIGGKEVASVTLSPSRSGEMLHTPSAMSTQQGAKGRDIPSLTSLQDHHVVHKPFFVLGGKSITA